MDGFGLLRRLLLLPASPLGLASPLLYRYRPIQQRPEAIMASSFPMYWIYREKDGRWSWKFAQSPQDTAAESSKRYATRRECADAIRMLRKTGNATLFASLEGL
jgi:uncharacterized protein YegP (UPF0339 family)